MQWNTPLLKHLEVRGKVCIAVDVCYPNDVMLKSLLSLRFSDNGDITKWSFPRKSLTRMPNLLAIGVRVLLERPHEFFWNWGHAIRTGQFQLQKLRLIQIIVYPDEETADLGWLTSAKGFTQLINNVGPLVSLQFIWWGKEWPRDVLSEWSVSATLGVGTVQFVNDDEPDVEEIVDHMVEDGVSVIASALISWF